MLLVQIDPTKFKTANKIEQERLDTLAAQMRLERDNKMKAVVNWYQRFYREERQDLAHALTLEQIDQYAAALADVPEQPGFPENVVWPSL